MKRIHVSPRAPQALILLCTPSDLLPDMTVITSSVVMLLRPDGTVASLACSASNKTPAALTLTHVFSVGDAEIPGVYRAYPVHSTPSGPVRGDVDSFEAVGDFD